MELQHVRDGKGNIYTHKKCNGRSYPCIMEGNIQDQLQNLEQVSFREDDVFLCLFFKSGTHWIHNIISLLRTGTMEYKAEHPILEFEDINRLENLDEPRIFVTHMPYDILPSGIKRGIGKVVYVIRNPKDVFVSCKFFLQSFTPNVYNGDMDGFLKIFLSDELGGFGTGGSWSTHTKEWDDGITSNPNLQVHIIKYEELKKDTYGEIEKLAKFLDVKYSKELLGNIVKEVAFDKMKAVHKTESGVTEKWTHICKDGRLPVYRKGIVGDWKNHLTVKQNELFDAVIEEKLSGRNIELIYE